jgi:hypothetical protein
MTRYLLMLLLALGLLGLAACSDDDDAPGATETQDSATETETDGTAIYSGYYQSGFETSNFVADTKCPREPGWWLTVEEAGFRERFAEVTEGDASELRTVFVRFEGRLSRRGDWGHLGEYDHEVTVVHLLEMEAAPEC